MPHTPTLSEPRVRSTVPGLHAATLSGESLRHESDDRLVALTRGGSERAFSEITRRYQRQLRSYCSRLVGVERAQDAVQQALLQAFLALRDGAPREIALRPWLYRIAHNCSIDQLRMGSWEYEQLDLESDGVPQPPALFEQKEELRGLVAGLRRLPDAQRQALTLRELEGCSYEEISARLGHTGSGVRQLIFRARSTLRKAAAALVFPLGFVRDRVAGMAPAVDTHQVAGMAAVPASSGGGFDTVGAAALAIVAMLGGVAGGVRGGGHDHRRTAETSQASLGTTALPVDDLPFAVAPAAQPDSRTPRDRDDARAGARRAPATPAATLGEAVAPVTAPPTVAAPVVPPQPAPPLAVPTAQAPPPAAAGEGVVVEQQTLVPARADGDASTGPVQPAPARAPAVPPGSGPTTAAPAKPRPPKKAQPAAGQPSVDVPKQVTRPGPQAGPVRPAKPAVPGKQKKNGSATVPAVAPR